jgi:hypothetical protein
VKSAVLYSHSNAADVPDYIGIISHELLLNPWDREILKDREFRFHPEYVEALARLHVEADTDLLVPATRILLAKG